MKCAIFLLTMIVLTGMSLGSVSADKTVIDGRGESVTLPDEIHRVVTVGDGFLEGVMYRLGVLDTLVGIGSSSFTKDYVYNFESVSGSNYTYKGGMNVIGKLDPKISDLPAVAAYGVSPNYEKIAELKPDVVIMRAGDCTFYQDDDAMKKTVERIESLGIPVVVTYGPNMKGRAANTADVSAISDEIKILGTVFDKKQQADELSSYLDKQVTLITDRTRDIPEDQKKKVLLLGLSPETRKSGAAADSWGTDSVESSFIEDVVNAKNAFGEPGQTKKLNAEQILALEPDVILLPTDWGYHPARELYEAPYSQPLQEMTAVKNKQVYALPWLPSNCDKRLEYPIELMVIAKATYPEKFEDINLADWLIDFYKNVYGVDDQMAKELRSAQWMDWTTEA